jgi:hypothetical protein
MPLHPIATKDKAGTPGKITRYFLVCCSICNQTEFKPGNTIDDFIADIEKGQWRLSRDHGWVHRHCMKPLFQSIQFNDPKPLTTFNKT